MESIKENFCVDVKIKFILMVICVWIYFVVLLLEMFVLVLFW